VTRLTFVVLLFLVADSRADGEAMYLANAGLMITEGDTKVLFDPLFRNGFGQYQLVPVEMEEALFAGEAPFDGVDAVFISHHHADHFSPADIVNYLRAQPAVRLFAPRQATEALLLFLSDGDDAVADRVTALDINYADKAITLNIANLTIEAFHIPHSGWPGRMSEIQNIAFRVTINSQITVLHLGDADARDDHFARDGDQWASRGIDAAFPPYWYFTSAIGSAVLAERLKPGMAVGVHVPIKLNPRYSEGLDLHDLFRRSGETRVIPHSD